jgi:hypothetical protein
MNSVAARMEDCEVVNMALSRNDVENISYVIRGLTHEMKRSHGNYSKGFIDAAQAIERAVILLKAGGGLTLDNIAGLCTKADCVQEFKRMRKLERAAMNGDDGIGARE